MMQHVEATEQGLGLHAEAVTQAGCITRHMQQIQVLPGHGPGKSVMMTKATYNRRAFCGYKATASCY
jgi:hypothetical protein